MITLNSYAKINLGLEILKKRADGFHEVSSILCKIDLSDQITFCLSDKNEVHQKGIKENENIVFKVLDYMTKKYNTKNKLKIVVDKNIPYSSGMGGGSSNAANAIEGINSILKLNLDSKEKFDIALKFGSDIPFFLSKSTAKVSGRGDKISFITKPKLDNVVIFYPNHNLKDKTKKVFQNLASFSDGSNQKNLLSKINNYKSLSPPFFNGLEEAANITFIDLNIFKSNLLDLGIPNLSMTGAGPTYYSICSSYKQASHLKDIVNQSNLDIFSFHTKLL